MNSEEIQQAIASFPRWHYQFNLRGELTPARHSNFNRQSQRSRYFFEPLVEHFGGSLAGKRVLDLGCNAGFWALQAIQAGCDYVVGVDGRQVHIDQANLVFEVNEVPRDRYELICADVLRLDYAELGTFDIVLCLGLLYHVCKPVELFERIAAVNTDVLLIDTSLSLAPGSYLQITFDSVAEPLNALDRSLVFYPTALALVHIVSQFGYSVCALKPDFTDYAGCEDYKQGISRAFVAVKGVERLSPPFEFEEIALPPGENSGQEQPISWPGPLHRRR